MGENKDKFTVMNINGQPQKVLCEEDYRKKLLIVCRTLGCEQEFRQWCDKYDRLLRNCRNPSEIAAIQATGIQALSDLIDNGYVGVDGAVVIRDKDGNAKVLVDDTKTKRHGGLII